MVAKTLQKNGIGEDHKCFATCSQRLFEISKYYLKVLIFLFLVSPHAKCPVFNMLRDWKFTFRRSGEKGNFYAKGNWEAGLKMTATILISVANLWCSPIWKTELRYDCPISKRICQNWECCRKRQTKWMEEQLKHLELSCLENCRERWQRVIKLLVVRKVNTTFCPCHLNSRILGHPKKSLTVKPGRTKRRISFLVHK